MSEVKNILVLGGGGFLGFNFLEEIISTDTSKKYNITVFAKSHSELLDKLAATNSNVKIVRGNYRNINEISEASKNQDIVYHFISETYPHNSWNNPGIEIETTFIPTLRLLETLVKCKVKKIVFLSSAGTVYGFNSNKLNEETITNPFSPHGIFKLTIENFLNYYHHLYNLNYDIYRIANAYGPNQDINKGLGFINTTINNIIKSKEAVIYCDGSIVRDYIYVKDIARLLALSLTKSISDSSLYIVSSGKEYSLNQLVQKIREIIPIEFKLKYIENRASDNKVVSLDNNKIMKLFPGFAFQSLEEGIKATYDFIKASK